MGNLVERMVLGQLETFLSDNDSLDPFQLGIHHDIETALVALLNDLLWEAYRGV